MVPLRQSHPGNHEPLVQSLLEEAVDSDDGWVYIPIRLKTGVERDRVIHAIVEQIRSIGGRLNREFPAAVP